MESCYQISVIIPVYNSERTIEKCLKSLLRQNYKNFEIIVVDDGSTDGTAQICKKMLKKDCRIKYFFENNAGVSAARNLGNTISKGKFITYIDGDDYVEYNHLHELIKPFLYQSNDLVVAGFIFEDENKHKLISTYHKNEKLSFYDAVESTFDARGIGGIVANKMFKASIVKKNKINFATDLKKYEDHLFTIEYLLYCTNITYTGSLTYHYVKHENSAMHKTSNLDFAVEKAAYDRIENMLLKNNRISTRVTRLIQSAEVNIAIANLFKSVNGNNRAVSKKYLREKLDVTLLFRKKTLREYLKWFFVIIKIYV